MWGTNNVDHQARICHSTTVAGVANTWGYGAMTNSFNDIHNSKSILNYWRQSSRSASGVVATYFPCQRTNGAQSQSSSIPALPVPLRTCRSLCPICVPAPTYRIGVGHAVWHIFENGWEDKEFIRQRVYGIEEMSPVRSPNGHPKKSKACHWCTRSTK